MFSLCITTFVLISYSLLAQKSIGDNNLPLMQSASFLFRNHNFPINIPDVLFDVHAVDVAEIDLLLTDGFHELISYPCSTLHLVFHLKGFFTNWQAMQCDAMHFSPFFTSTNRVPTFFRRKKLLVCCSDILKGTSKTSRSEDAPHICQISESGSIVPRRFALYCRS